MEDIVKETFLQVQAMGVWNESSAISMEDFAEYIAAQTNDLLALANVQTDSAKLKELKLEELMRIPFKDAKEVIMLLPLYKRISLLSSLEELKEHLYHSISRYKTGIPKEEQISAKTFRHLMTKISHLEILQGWLYGIE